MVEGAIPHNRRKYTVLHTSYICEALVSQLALVVKCPFKTPACRHQK